MEAMQSPVVEYQPRVQDHGFLWYCLTYYVFLLLCGVAFAVVNLWGIPHILEYEHTAGIHLPIATEWTVSASRLVSRFWIFAGCAGIMMVLPPCLTAFTLQSQSNLTRKRVLRGILWSAIVLTLIVNGLELFSMIVPLL